MNVQRPLKRLMLLVSAILGSFGCHLQPALCVRDVACCDCVDDYVPKPCPCLPTDVVLCCSCESYLAKCPPHACCVVCFCADTYDAKCPPQICCREPVPCRYVSIRERTATVSGIHDEILTRQSSPEGTSTVAAREQLPSGRGDHAEDSPPLPAPLPLELFRVVD